MWSAVFWIVCRHQKKKVVKCFAVGELDAPCDGWDDEPNKQETLTHNGHPYTPLLNEKCPECRWEALLDAMEERERRDRERRDRERRDREKGGGTNGINGTHGTNKTRWPVAR
jgi:hypothetical protein